MCRPLFSPLSTLFQSTHPLRGATSAAFYPLPVSGISIHAPLAGCDPGQGLLKGRRNIFQSTHPLRGATLHKYGKGAYFLISIHAPLAGCDPATNKGRWRLIYFNPRTPCGVRLPGRIHKTIAGNNFNPRTPCGVRQRKCTKFSAHFAITDNSIGFPRPECRLLGHFLLIPGACSARERVRTFL